MVSYVNESSREFKFDEDETLLLFFTVEVFMLFSERTLNLRSSMKFSLLTVSGIRSWLQLGSSHWFQMTIVFGAFWTMHGKIIVSFAWTDMLFDFDKINELSSE